MFTHYNTKGIILEKRGMREADEVITLYTYDFGRVDIVGRSLRKANSKLKMNTSLFSLVEIGFVQGRSCNRMVDVRIINSFNSARRDLAKMSLFYRLSEIFLSLVRGEEKDKEIFSFILRSFEKIEEISFKGDSLKLFYCFFSFRLLYLLGYKIYTEGCAVCDARVEKECYFNAKEGGVICNNCYQKNEGIYLEDIRHLKSFFEEEEKRNIFKQDVNDFINMLESYLSLMPERAKRA